MASLGHPLAATINNFENHLDPVAFEQQRRRGGAGSDVPLHTLFQSTLSAFEDDILLFQTRYQLEVRDLRDQIQESEENRASSRKIALLSNFISGSCFALILFAMGLHFLAAAMAAVTILCVMYHAFFKG